MPHNFTQAAYIPRNTWTTDARIEPPIIYLPDNISVLNDHELQQIRDMPLPNLQKLNYIYSQVTTSRHMYDLDAVMYIHQASLQQTQRTNWVIISLTSIATITTLNIFIYFLCNNLRNTYCITCKTNVTTSPSQPSIEPSKLRNEASTSSEENTNSNMLFTSYALQQSK